MTRREKYLLGIIICLILAQIGTNLNIFVKESNNNKMPIFVQGNKVSLDDKHFTYTALDKVNYPFLTDIFNLPFGVGIMSIGDLIIWISSFTSLYFILCFIWRKNEKDN